MTMPRAQELLREVFGFDGFRTGQREVIDHILAGRPVLAALRRCGSIQDGSGMRTSPPGVPLPVVRRIFSISRPNV
jgi:hypothetical protein